MSSDPASNPTSIRCREDLIRALSAPPYWTVVDHRDDPGYTRSLLDALKSGRVRAVAMSVYASGAIPADEAIHWISELPGVESIVFGASSAGNIRSTKALVDKYMGDTVNA